MSTPETLEKLQGVLDRFEVTVAQAQELLLLQEYEMVIIADDSASMMAPADEGFVSKTPQTEEEKENAKKLAKALASQYKSKHDPKKLKAADRKNRARSAAEKKQEELERKAHEAELLKIKSDMHEEKNEIKTRWHELQISIQYMVDVAACFDDSGVDVFFLNREAVLGVKSSEDERLVEAFETAAEGSTPLASTMRQVVDRTWGERKVLLFILTDGEPDEGQEAFENVLGKLIARGKLKVQIMACTSDKNELEWMNGLDKQYAEVDVVDDYLCEKEEVLAAGVTEKFTRGDWVMKAMLGPISNKFDAWDEAVSRVAFLDANIPMGSGCGRCGCSETGCCVQ